MSSIIILNKPSNYCC